MSVRRMEGTAHPDPCGVVEDPHCTVREVLQRISEKWSVMVVAALAERPQRFRELQRGIDGISQRMLTLTVRRLERDGLVSRTVVATVPPQVTYALTDEGASLTYLVRGLTDWADAHGAFISAARARYDQAHPDNAIG